MIAVQRRWLDPEPRRGQSQLRVRPRGARLVGYGAAFAGRRGLPPDGGRDRHPIQYLARSRRELGRGNEMALDRLGRPIDPEPHHRGRFAAYLALEFHN